MDKLEYKKKVLEKAKEVQQSVIHDFQRRIKDVQLSEMVVNEGQNDYGQQGADDSSNLMINKVADQLNFAVEEMDLLNKMYVDNHIHDSVSVCSVVKTDKKTFFTSIGIEDFEYNGDKLFGISTKAPLYKEMDGKKVGDTIEYNGVSYQILEIF